ncbi:hypothetical protein A4X13_0g1755 [Tilletia indica]|uniref:Uncharacterized protein n=1 Tax=Tilletia indica TaxID=43049 RepID=A0A177TIX0_9BASI|nr:hypothetical protein A4X13_0g1755 [Tilletia indica]
MSGNSNPGNFANRPHEEVVEIARKGGKASGHSHGRSDSGDTDTGYTEGNETGADGAKGKQGFAAMPTEKVKEIAAKGGRSSGYTGTSNDADDEDLYVEEDA